MATESFDKKFVISDKKDIKRFYEVINDKKDVISIKKFAVPDKEQLKLLFNK